MVFETTLQTRDTMIWPMNQALEYIYENVEKELTLEEIAKVASLSKFHFHRIFKMVTSENLGQFIQRLRIEKALSSLYHGEESALTEIALQCGFSSSSYFSRIFKSYYGISASEFRNMKFEDKKRFIRENVKGIRKCNDILQHQEHLTVEIREIPTLEVAYIRKCYFDIADEERIVHHMFEYIVKWGESKGLMNQYSKVVGVIHDNLYITPFDKYQYDACISVSTKCNGEEMVGYKEVGGSTYAVLKMQGVTLEEMQSQIFTFISWWIPSFGYGIAESPILEFYGKDCTWNNYTMEFCVPICLYKR